MWEKLLPPERVLPFDRKDTRAEGRGWDRCLKSFDRLATMRRGETILVLLGGGGESAPLLCCGGVPRFRFPRVFAESHADSETIRARPVRFGQGNFPGLHAP